MLLRASYYVWSYPVVRTYMGPVDTGPERPAVAQSLDDTTSAERDFDAVVVWSFSLFSRNVQPWEVEASRLCVQPPTSAL